MTEYKVVWSSKTDFHGESSESLTFAVALASAKDSAKDYPSFAHFVVPFSAPNVGTREFEIWAANAIVSGKFKVVGDERIMVVR